MKKILYPLFLMLLISFTACDPNRVFEKNEDLQESDWKKEDTLSFDFEIQDKDIPYNLFYTVRYNSSYRFYNLFAKYYILDSAGHVLTSPPLPEDMYLFDVKTGEPNGSGFGNIYDQKIGFLKGYKFPYAGKFHIKVAQYMRDQPLPGMVSFGIRIEKTLPEEKQ